MTFSAADLPVDFPNPLSDLVKALPQVEPKSRQLSAAQIDALTSKVDEAVGPIHTVLDGTLAYDRNWRTAVFRGETEYDQEIEDRIRSSLESWAQGAEAFLSALHHFKSFGIHPAVAETLRPRLAEVRAMLTPDDEFFEGEGLDELTAGALAEDERGETVEFRAMGE